LKARTNSPNSSLAGGAEGRRSREFVHRRNCQRAIRPAALRHREEDHACGNEGDLSFTWRKRSMHVARSAGKIRRPPSDRPPPSRRGVAVPPRSSNLNTFTAHGSALAAGVVSGSAGYLPLDLSIECITFAHVNIARISGRKMAPGRPSPAANPLIYRLRVSACIRRLGHMPLLHHLPPSFASRTPRLPPLLTRPPPISPCPLPG